MNKHFTHLHVHTEFSLLDGAIRIPDLVQEAKKQEWKAIGISDHGNVFGAVKFFQLAKKEGIKPILGCEMYFIPDASKKDATEKYYHLTLIVQNRKGYENLCQLFSFAYKEGFYFKPRIDYSALEKFNEGLIVASGCVGGYIPTLVHNNNLQEAKKQITWFKEVFGSERFYLEIMPEHIEKQSIVNKNLFELSQQMKVQCVATGDAHYLLKEDHQAHEVLLAIQTKHLLSDPNRFSFGQFKGHLHTTQEMLDAFVGHEQAIWNSGKIADSCEFEFQTGKLFFPEFPTPKHHTQENFFKKLCTEGLEKLYAQELVPTNQLQIYKERLQREVSLIIKMGYVGYFLVVSDFTRWAKDRSITIGPGRGSVVGSLVAWALQITNVNPIKYNLLFERFLNPERVSMPDIDIDFCVERREEVINYVKDTYGHDSVCQIITFGTMMAKGVIKDVARVLGFPFADAHSLTNLVPNQLKITLDQALEQEPKLKEMMQSNPEVQHLIQLCYRLEGVTRHASKHAAGVVISPEPLRQVLPLYIPAKTTELITQYAMTELESLGFLKMDFLGLTNLTIIEKTLKAIQRNYSVQINLDKLALDDVKTFELLCKGQTNGVFQFESSGVKDVLRKLQPNKFEDLIAVNALYRPGPLGSGMIEDFIDRRHGRKKTIYMLPELEPILAETYGVIVYQEQVMKIASTIAGYSLGSADILRRAMGKKKADVMAEQKEKFVRGAKERGFNTKKIEELFDLVAYFAGYGFNKSHSTAYALIAYHTAYLKANYPSEFMAILLSSVASMPDKMSFYLQEVHEIGLQALPPNINTSQIEFAADKETILFGLQGIKNVGQNALENIIAQRTKKPFIDLFDFCTRIDLRIVNKRVIESLIYAGTFDALPGNRAQKTIELDKIIALAQNKKLALKTGQMGLFSAEKKVTDSPGLYLYQPLADWPEKEKLRKEKEVAGFYLSSHPLQSYEQRANWFSFSSFSHLIHLLERKNVTEPQVICYALLQSIKKITTKKGDPMAFAQFEDITGQAEVIIFPRLYARIQAILQNHSVFIIQGTLDIAAQGVCKIKAQDIIAFDLYFAQWPHLKNITLTLPLTFNQYDMNTIKDSFDDGQTPLHIAFHENGQTLLARTKKRVCSSVEKLEKLQNIGIGIKLII